ncbi:MAG TPA: hypothetical protein VKF59_02050, partial [Candidatus Dormibacteraeota bacterium]|nr:hypothetical protein [Candidatus Dormibacteraeota bacterium]
MALPTRPAARPGSTLWSHLAAAVPVAAALGLAELIAASAARAGWAPGSSILPSVALAAVAAGGLLAAGRIGAAEGLGLGALGGLAVAAAAAIGGLPPHEWPALARSWPGELASGRAAGDPALLRFLVALLVWLAAAWLAWAVLRVRAVLWAVAPAGAILAVDVLNFPDGQDAYVFWFLVVTLTFLLWSTYRESVASALRHGLELADGARWDFWERGAVALAALIATGVLLPPLSGVDQTAAMQNGLVRAWGRVTHASGGAGVATSSGFSDEVLLGGPLRQSNLLVFTYSVGADAPGPSYFHGLDLGPLNGEWAFPSAQLTTQRLASGDQMAYAEQYGQMASATYAIDMLRPPSTAPDLIFYPGRLVAADRALRLAQLLPPGMPGGPAPETVDRATAADGRGSYHVLVDESTASEDALRGAGTDYPSWIGPYRSLPGFYRPAAALAAIRLLAQQVTAGVADPYDQASAIEAYLRASFMYTLSPPPVPAGTDPEEYFLLTGHE